MNKRREAYLREARRIYIRFLCAAVVMEVCIIGVASYLTFWR